MGDDEQLAARQRWFEQYVERVSSGSLQPQLPDKRYTCPCCGYPTLTERGGYEICELCGWEDDGQDDPHANEVWGGPNGRYSLAEARSNFKQHRSMYSPSEEAQRTKRYKPNLARIEAKSRLIEAFESLAIKCSETWNKEQWNQIMQLENAVRKAHDQLPLP